MSNASFFISKSEKENAEWLMKTNETELISIIIRAYESYNLNKKDINTLKKRAHDIGGNAIGVYDYKEKRRVYVKQHGYEVDSKDILNQIWKPKMEYVLIKENQKVASITADVFKCRKSTKIIWKNNLNVENQLK